ncbi:hypothetical protein [Neokomagataea anthophila]|uniref:Transcriptional regulator n=1 Tax=Neokomagataea anthophila TaxID=2826925 RepID=A0ABS5E6N9_9PROT|nr:hypothetical protein [Neokomagataea anthophila]MBR0559521.1 hypothetical protein [Neokomagataea anthophila]
MRKLVIAPEHLQGLFKAMENDLTEHLQRSAHLSVEGEIAVARLHLAEVENHQALVLSEDNEKRMWAVAQAALTAVLIGCVDRGLNRPKIDVN